ncbi:MAG: 4Fe-4S single cluster domain-containing protein [Verrucomicrobiota bacterium]|jgi:anaerobic ribonucleoside-triphosphate reductase activating protein
MARSFANGPGRRAVIWTQGCSLGCHGCFNPETHSREGGQIADVAHLGQMVLELSDELEGLTISGGEPLQQMLPLLELLELIRQQSRLSIILFSGFEFAEIQRFPKAAQLLGCLDVLIAGRYDQRRRFAAGLRGSTNKTIHLLSPRYSAADLEAVPAAEAVISPDGALWFSGIDPLDWKST